MQLTLFNHPLYSDYVCNINTGEIYSLKNNQIKLLKQRFNKYNSYLRFKIGKVKHYYSHRFIWECYYNEILPRNIDVDHRDRNRFNNHINNLRKVIRI